MSDAFDSVPACMPNSEACQVENHSALKEGKEGSMGPMGLNGRMAPMAANRNKQRGFTTAAIRAASSPQENIVIFSKSKILSTTMERAQPSSYKQDIQTGTQLGI